VELWRPTQRSRAPRSVTGNPRLQAHWVWWVTLRSLTATSAEWRYGSSDGAGTRIEHGHADRGT
jgi:hypothetical protein